MCPLLGWLILRNHGRGESRLVCNTSENIYADGPINRSVLGHPSLAQAAVLPCNIWLRKFSGWAGKRENKTWNKFHWSPRGRCVALPRRPPAIYGPIRPWHLFRIAQKFSNDFWSRHLGSSLKSILDRAICWRATQRWIYYTLTKHTINKDTVNII
jgi:hypothetical protein